MRWSIYTRFVCFIFLPIFLITMFWSTKFCIITVLGFSLMSPAMDRKPTYPLQGHIFPTWSHHGKGCWIRNCIVPLLLFYHIIIIWIQQLLFFFLPLWICQLAVEYAKYCSWNNRNCSSLQNHNNLADRQGWVFPSSWVLLSIHFDRLVSYYMCIWKMTYCPYWLRYSKLFK